MSASSAPFGVTTSELLQLYQWVVRTTEPAAAVPGALVNSVRTAPDRDRAQSQIPSPTPASRAVVAAVAGLPCSLLVVAPSRWCPRPQSLLRDSRKFSSHAAHGLFGSRRMVPPVLLVGRRSRRTSWKGTSFPVLDSRSTDDVLQVFLDVPPRPSSRPREDSRTPAVLVSADPLPTPPTAAAALLGGPDAVVAVPPAMLRNPNRPTEQRLWRGRRR